MPLNMNFFRLAEAVPYAGSIPPAIDEICTMVGSVYKFIPLAHWLLKNAAVAIFVNW